MAEASKQRSKRLYEMSVAELEAEAIKYEQAGNEMWAQMCREQIDLNYRVADAFQRKCRERR